MESSSEKCSKLKLLSKCYVKPTNNLPNDASKKPIYLGGTDVFMLTMDTMQRGLLFNTKLQANTLTNLKNSLYIALVHFYPLAGQLATKKFEDEHACCFYLDCEAGPGARLIHAAADYTVCDILSSVDVHPIVESFFDLGEKSVNYDGHTSPLLSVQVTELQDGVAIGFTMNHCVADGNSLWHFIATLSEIFNQIKNGDENNNIQKSWLHDLDEITISRKPICETLFPYVGYGPSFKVPYLEPDEFINRYDPGPLRVRMFHFSTQSVLTLKAQANEQCGLQNKISSFQALSAFMWRSIMRARKLQPDDEVRCTVLMNARTRFNPPLPLEYFRCLSSGAFSVTKMRDLMSTNLGQIALLVHKSVTEQDEKYYRKLVQHLESNPRCIIQHGSGSINNITFGGSTRSNIYGSEFGLGKAVAALAGYANKSDGKMTANPGPEGGGSVDLEVCLKPETMNALELDREFMSFVSLGHS